MYLFVPPGLLTTIWEGYTNLVFKSSYWKNEGDTHTLSFKWENASYIFVLNTHTKKTYLNITIDDIPKFTFSVYELHLSTSADTGVPEQLTFKVSNTRNEFGDFTLYAIEKK